VGKEGLEKWAGGVSVKLQEKVGLRKCRHS